MNPSDTKLRARRLALIDLELRQRPDHKIAEEMGMSRSTLFRIRKTEEYESILHELIGIDDLAAGRIQVKIKELFQEFLLQVGKALENGPHSLSDLNAIGKTLAKFQPALVSQEPGTQLAIAPQDFHPATVLVQNMYVGQQQGEIVDGQVKVLPVGVEGARDGE